MNQLFKRNSLEHIVNWGRRSVNERKPLVLRGARQVGKSTLVHQLAEKLGLDLVELNLEKKPSLQKIFEVQDFDSILSAIESLTKSDLRDPKKLLFIDEIQKSPRAIETLRYFFEDIPELKVIAAGSLLDFTLTESKLSMPVGRIQYGYLQPATFTEFLSAIDQSKLGNIIKSYELKKFINPAVHEELLKYYRIYMFVGGMPEAVKTWTNKKKSQFVSEVHQSILSTYRDDFGKYASGKELLRLQKTFDQFPSNLGRKIKYSKLAPEEQARDIRKIIDILVKARILHKVHHSNCSGIPLSAQIDEFVYKIYFLDVGLMGANLDLDLETLINNNKTSLAEGVLVEQCIFQNIKAAAFDRDLQVYYWLREAKQHNAEVDFVISNKGNIIPIEIKSGKSGSLRSLHQFVFEKESQMAIRFDANLPSVQNIKHSVVTTKGTKEIKFSLISLPCYLAEEIWRII